MQSDVRLKQSELLLDLLALCVAIGFVIGGLIVRGRLPIIPLGLAIEAELEPLIGFYYSLPCGWRLWASDTP